MKDPSTGKTSPVTERNFDTVKEKWKVISGFISADDAEKLFDDNEETAWNTNRNLPVDIIVDTGELNRISGFTYLPEQSRWSPGIIFNYEFFVSRNGTEWGDPVSEGEFSNIRNSPVWQEKRFEPVNGRYIKLRAVSAAEENGRIGIAELDIITD